MPPTMPPIIAPTFVFEVAAAAVVVGGEDGDAANSPAEVVVEVAKFEESVSDGPFSGLMSIEVDACREDGQANAADIAVEDADADEEVNAPPRKAAASAGLLLRKAPVRSSSEQPMLYSHGSFLQHPRKELPSAIQV